jgi:hypothetical protein
MVGPGSKSVAACVPGSTGPRPGWYPEPDGPGIATLLHILIASCLVEKEMDSGPSPAADGLKAIALISR